MTLFDFGFGAILTGATNFAFQLIGFFVAFILILFLAYFSIRIMGRARTTGRSNKNIRLIEAMGVGPQVSLQLIKAGDKYFLIGVSRGSITLLGEVSADSINTEDKTINDMPFEKYFTRFLPKKKNDDENESGN